jgi:Na+/H+ antiporter NhaA
MKYRAFSRITNPIREFARLESVSGLVLLVCTGIALFFANSFLNMHYFSILQQELTLGIDGITLSKTLLHWINDGLMPLFFFVVGLEMKREMLHGELSSPRQAALPIVCISFLGLGLFIWMLLWLVNFFHIKRILPYAILGIGVWLAFLKSGNHPTIAGVFVAMTIPSGSRDSDASQRISLLNTLELYLHPWISFGIVPLFAWQTQE